MPRALTGTQGQHEVERLLEVQDLAPLVAAFGAAWPGAPTTTTSRPEDSTAHGDGCPLTPVILLKRTPCDSSCNSARPNQAAVLALCKSSQ